MFFLGDVLHNEQEVCQEYGNKKREIPGFLFLISDDYADLDEKKTYPFELDVLK